MRKRADLCALALYFLEAALLVGLPFHDWRRMIPLGSEPSATVPLFNLWTLGWNVRVLRGGYQGYWNAPIFYPVTGAFAFSDPQPLTGLLAAPLWRFAPAAAYNLILVGFLALNGWSAYRLFRWRGMPFSAAVVAATLLPALPFFTQERGVLQLQPVFGMLWATVGLWALIRRPRWQAAVLFAVGVVVTFATSEYYGLFLVSLLFPLGVIGLLHWRRRGLFWPALGALVIVVALSPLLWPQSRILNRLDFHRSASTIQRNSASLADVLQPPHITLGGKFVRSIPDHHQHLFPGLSLLVLGVLGLVFGVRDPRQRRWVAFLAGSAVLALLLAFGLNLRLGPWVPYAGLRAIPGFENLRSPFRWAVWTQVALALLVGVAVARLWHGRRWLAVLAVFLALVETAPLPVAWVTVPPPFPQGTLQGVTLFLPLPHRRRASAFEQTTRWMVGTLEGDVWLVNGYSGYFPGFEDQLEAVERTFPSSFSLRVLQAIGVQTVAVPSEWMTPARRKVVQTMVAKGALRPPALVRDLYVFDLGESQRQSIQAFAGDWALEAERRDGALRLRMYPLIEDKGVYLLAPDLEPVTWQVQLLNGSRAIQDTMIRPRKPLLFYHGSGRWVTFSVPLAADIDLDHIRLLRPDDGKVLAEEPWDVP